MDVKLKERKTEMEGVSSFCAQNRRFDVLRVGSGAVKNYCHGLS